LIQETAMHPTAVPALAQAKWAFTTRHVDRRDVQAVQGLATTGRAGDLMLAEVVQLGQHDGVQLESGRRAQLYVGDRIVVCLGDRYAPDQFEGVAQLRDGACELLAGGGVAGIVRQRHGRMRSATHLRVIGWLLDGNGQALNIERYALALPEAQTPQVPVIVVSGSSMNAGKTTACASLIHGLARAGRRVGAVKVTGTGSFGDVQSYADAGAAEVLDFTDGGLASTYRVGSAVIEQLSLRLIGELQRRRCDVVVVEVADGLFQQETAALLASRRWSGALRQAVFAAADAMGAVAGVQRLRQLGWQVQAFTGLVTASPLAAAEAAAALCATGQTVPCLTREELRCPVHAQRLLADARALQLAA
jgi:molybdopterin-guanine dinucleotide biosynthesis protein